MTRRGVVTSHVLFACSLALLSSAPARAVTTVQSTSATALANALAGTGLTVLGATLTSDTQNGFFSGGASALGIDQGVVLTTGQLSCIGSANTGGGCGSSNGTSASLAINFTLASTSLFFSFVFGSEEYNSYVGSNFNDSFSLTLTGPGFAGVNLAQLPGGGGLVSINNVNLDRNRAFFRNNTIEATGSDITGGSGTTAPSLNLPIELDGLTTVLTASAFGLTPGATYTLNFAVTDVGDSSFDSAVFIGGGSIGATPPSVPEPASWAMMIGGFAVVGGAARRRLRGRRPVSV